ncbi:MAG: acylase [Cyclobacteriaceae bacterium]|nr:acylase [Cyclobacteriaceae bacterium]
MKKIIFLVLLSSSVFAQKFTPQEISRWKAQAKGITITRDTWGVPHIAGKTDADAVFGLLYAQCENDFERVERNYLIAIARLAEVEGESFIYHDLRTRLYQDTVKAIALYKSSPNWMKKVCMAFADGINFYLYTHPDVKPKLIKRFQPWMPLLFSEGSIGGDIERVSLAELKNLYGTPNEKTARKEDQGDGSYDNFEPEPKGSNGFAIAPSKSASGNSLLLINPHTSFYFRSEVHMKSDEGLNAYGAVTWGQFFIYQGFNEHCGWMHTTSGADSFDSYWETIIEKDKKQFYKYGTELKPLTSQTISIFYKSPTGRMKKDFTVFRTHHGPVVELHDGKMGVIKIMDEPLKALTQSYQRTKAASLDDFKNTMALQTNSSNNTVYADDKGNISYWHGDFIPRRDPSFDWSMPLDGSNPATDWKGLHPLEDIVQIHNPASGWIQNCNSTPFTVSGESSPKKENYLNYIAPDAENARGIHAVKVLKDEKAFTLDKLIAAAYDSYLPGFERLIPSLVSSYNEQASKSDTLSVKLSEPLELLRNWDLRFSETSIPTTLAVYWAQHLRQDVALRIPSNSDQLAVIDFLEKGTSSSEKLKALSKAMNELQRSFGSWKKPWGEINRFQRITGKIESVFDDNQPSIAVPFTSSYWGSLAAFGARKYSNTKKIYGSVGNSFVAVVEFGKKVRARSIVTGGSSSDPSSLHFNDQSAMYAQGKFKDVLFYDEDIKLHVERSYHPGDL